MIGPPPRLDQEERLDDVGHDPEMLRASMEQVAAVDRWLGGRRGVRRVLRSVMAEMAGEGGHPRTSPDRGHSSVSVTSVADPGAAPLGNVRPFRILDVGTGNGQVLAETASWLQKELGSADPGFVGSVGPVGFEGSVGSARSARSEGMEGSGGSGGSRESEKSARSAESGGSAESEKPGRSGESGRSRKSRKSGKSDVAAARRAVAAVGIDMHPEIVPLAGRRPGILPVRGDGTRMPFADDTFDVAITTLTLHHFSFREAVELLREMARVSRSRVIVSDLERSRLHYLGARLLAETVWRGNALTRNDGPISVLRSFTSPELLQLARVAGLREVRVRRIHPFRLVMEGRP